MIKIITDLPGPRAQQFLTESSKYEPRSMSEQVPVVWSRGERCYIEDVDGNVFLDWSSGVLVANVGHSHPQLVEEMRAQAGLVVNSYDFVNPYRPALARKLVEITPPNLDKAFILSTGAEATEAALKLARKATGKKELIGFHGAFHGRTYGAMSVGGTKSGHSTQGFGPFLPQVYLAPFPYCYRCPFGRTHPECDTQCFSYLELMVQRETEGDIAGVITEAYQGGAGSIIPPAAWMKKLEAWCRKNDVVFIMDEVQASFGRTGRMFCFEHYDVTPNLLCLGKGISSSVPVSALVGESKLMDVLEPGTMSSTHGGNAFCSRVALRNVELIEEERLVENSAKVGAYFGERFADLQQRCDRLGDARGMGMVWGLEMVKTKEGKEPDTEITRRIIDGCFRRGLLLIAPIGLFGNVIRVAPPLVMTEEEAKIGCDILAEVMMEAAAH